MAEQGRFTGVRACVFDAYGTLFDVNAAARACAAEPGREALSEVWPRLGAVWRDKQLQYTWLRAAMGEHVDFWRITADGLDYAMAAVGLSDAGMRKRLLELYWELDAYPEVTEALRALKAAGFKTAILSNGTPAMLDAAVSNAGMSGILDDVMSVEEVQVFKPHPFVYQMAIDHLGVEADEIAFFSSNGWDAAAASWYGFQTAWVNRSGLPAETLPWKPATILKDLSTASQLVAA